MQVNDIEPIAPEIGSIVPHPPTFLVSQLPDDVFPTLITVFCDQCGRECTEDVIVHEADSSPRRCGYLRAHLRRQGWQCDEGGDNCPECHGRLIR
jgi:hypothetical protein